MGDFGTPGHRKRHVVNSTKDHLPIPGDHDENSIVVYDGNGLPVKDSGLQLSSIASGLQFVDNWDASGGTYPLPTREGQYWIISVAGTIGGIDYELKDWLVFIRFGTPPPESAPAIWRKIDNTESSHYDLDGLDWNVAGHNMNTDLDMDSHKVIECTGVEGPADTNCGIEAGTGFDCFSKLGDKLGVNSHEFRDSDGIMQAKVNSLGKGQFKGIDAQNTKISNMADGSLANDAMAYGQRYTDSQAQTAVKYKPDVTLAGVSPVDADVSSWTAGDRGHGIGTGGREFYMVKRGTAVKYVELS